MSTADPIATAIDAIRGALAGYVFRVRSEAELQAQVFDVVCQCAGTKADGEWFLPGAVITREVKAPGSRFDILVQTYHARIVLELKLKASAASVERQAQRYALMPDVDAVVVVTTSRRLAAQLTSSEVTLGGKPFHVIPLRTS